MAVAPIVLVERFPEGREAESFRQCFADRDAPGFASLGSPLILNEPRQDPIVIGDATVEGHRVLGDLQSNSSPCVPARAKYPVPPARSETSTR